MFSTCEEGYVFFQVVVNKYVEGGGTFMGTFLKVAGILVLIAGIVMIFLSVAGMWWLGYWTSPPGAQEEEQMLPLPWGMVALAERLGAVAGGVLVFLAGAALFCVGSIYNDIKELKSRLSP